MSNIQKRKMPILKDFTGYEQLVPFIEGVKAGRCQTSKITSKIKSDKALQKMFDYMDRDLKMKVEDYLSVIANAFSKGNLEGILDKSHFSFVRKIYEYCSDNWCQIEETVSFLRQIDIEKEMYLRVEKFLPKVIKPANMTVYFVLDGGDCRGFKEEVYADITLLTILGKTKALGLLAHEFHHCCRAEIAVPYEEDRHPAVFQVLYWLESEGIADKVYDLGSNEPDNEFEPLLKLIKIRRRIYWNAGKYLKLFDKAVQNSENPIPIFSKNAYHPVGHFMADIIENTLGTRELVNTVGDPFYFVETYNKSAKILRKSGVYILSNKTISKLQKIKAEI
jgi:hypothetical protein